MVTGLGGVFIKADDPKFLARWYEDNLGIGFRDLLYFSFKWREIRNTEEVSYSVLSFFKQDTTYFYPSTNDIMINFRVNDLDGLRIKMQKNGVQVIDKVESYEYGRFGWAMDPEGNKLELWEPIDAGFEDRYYPLDLKNVSGLGGVFIKSAFPDKLMNWYSQFFEMDFVHSMHTFHWKDFTNKDEEGKTIFSFLPDTTIYFLPSPKNFMLNLRVNNLDEILKDLKQNGEFVSEKQEEYEYGKFGWILDPENNKLELWEPTKGSL
jgi:predicted enzyme related to lactoylglutathione lyase